MIHKLLFFIKEAFSGIRHVFMMTTLSYFTIVISLLILAAFLIVNFHLSDLSKYMLSKLEIRVFVHDTLTKRELSYFQKTLEDIPGVSAVELIDRDSAWKDFSSSYDHLDLEKLVDHNPLLHSFKVSLVDSSMLLSTSRTIKGFSYYVDSAFYGGDESMKLRSLSKFVMILGWALVSFLSFASLFFVVNTIKLTIVNRSEEITIMKLVGATDTFIMGPFIIEALIIGLAASSTAIGVCIIVNSILLNKLSVSMPFLPLNLSFDKLWLVYMVVILWGSILASLAALISTRSTLKKSV